MKRRSKGFINRTYHRLFPTQTIPRTYSPISQALSSPRKSRDHTKEQVEIARWITPELVVEEENERPIPPPPSIPPPKQ